MNNKYPIQFTIGQSLFILGCVLVLGFFTFYLGARFGPEFFWGVSLEKLGSSSILPSEVSEKELLDLLKNEKNPQLTFHKILEKKSSTVFIPQPQNEKIVVEKPQTTKPILKEENPVLTKESVVLNTNPVIKEKNEVKEIKPVEIKDKPKDQEPLEPTEMDSNSLLQKIQEDLNKD